MNSFNEDIKARKPKTFYIGLVGGGKTTLYRQLNENKEMNAVEIELPRSCLNDEVFISNLFDLYYYNDNIDCIIAHPCCLPHDFWRRISKKDTIRYLDIPLDERIARIKKRSKEIETNPDTLFSTEFIKQEEEYYINFKNKVVQKMMKFI